MHYCGSRAATTNCFSIPYPSLTQKTKFYRIYLMQMLENCISKAFNFRKWYEIELKNNRLRHTCIRISSIFWCFIFLLNLHTFQDFWCISVYILYTNFKAAFLMILQIFLFKRYLWYFYMNIFYNWKCNRKYFVLNYI